MTVVAGEAITFTFVVTHTGDHADVVINTARYSGPMTDSTITRERANGETGVMSPKPSVVSAVKLK